jgi:alanine racemase
MAKLIDNNTDLVDIYIFENISNAIFARQTGITKKIIVLYYVSLDEILLASEYNLEITCPNIEWLLQAVTILDNKKLKLHVYVDLGIGRYGFIDFNQLYDLMYKINNYSNLELVGLGTRFNPMVSFSEITKNKLQTYEPNISQNRKEILKKYIQLQINTFNSIINSSLDQNLINEKTQIHAACSIEILNELDEVYYDFVRVGSLVHSTIYQKFKVNIPVINIKKIPENFCVGYYCKTAITQKPFNVAYIKYYGFPNNTIYKYNDIELDIFIKSDPMGLTIPDGTNIRVGDNIQVTIE